MFASRHHLSVNLLYSSKRRQHGCINIWSASFITQNVRMDRLLKVEDGWTAYPMAEVWTLFSSSSSARNLPGYKTYANPHGNTSSQPPTQYTCSRFLHAIYAVFPPRTHASSILLVPVEFPVIFVQPGSTFLLASTGVFKSIYNKITHWKGWHTVKINEWINHVTY